MSLHLHRSPDVKCMAISGWKLPDKVHAFGFTEQVIPKHGCGQLNHGKRPFAYGFALEVTHPMLSHDPHGFHPRLGKNPLDTWYDFRYGSVFRSGVERQKGHAAFRSKRATHEVPLPPNAAEFVTTNELRIYLAEKIHFHGGIDGNRPVVHGNYTWVVDVAGRIAFHGGVVVDKII